MKFFFFMVRLQALNRSLIKPRFRDETAYIHYSTFVFYLISINVAIGLMYLIDIGSRNNCFSLRSTGYRCHLK